MHKLSRYVIRETIGLYIFGVAAFCLLLSIDMLTTWARFLLEQEASLATIARLMLYRLPAFLHLSMPIAIVFAVLLATGRLAKDSELKAAYSLGAQPLSLLTPLLAVGLAVSGLALINNGYIEPVSQRSYEALVDSFFYTRPPPAVQTDVAYRTVDNGIFYAARIRANPDDRQRAELSGVFVRRHDGTSMSAAAGLWDSEARVWRLQNVEVVELDGNKAVVPELELAFDVDAVASEGLVSVESLTLGELSVLIERQEASGGTVRGLRYQFHSRIADAFSALVFALLASVLGLQLHNRAAGFGWTIALLVLFWAVWILAGDLFDRGVLSPVVAAWFTSAVVGALGLAIAYLRLR